MKKVICISFLIFYSLSSFSMTLKEDRVFDKSFCEIDSLSLFTDKEKELARELLLEYEKKIKTQKKIIEKS